jgi:hypothetical protein
MIVEDFGPGMGPKSSAIMENDAEGVSGGAAVTFGQAASGSRAVLAPMRPFLPVIMVLRFG